MSFEDWLLEKQGLTAETLSRSELADLYDEFRKAMRKRREASSKHATHGRYL